MAKSFNDKRFLVNNYEEYNWKLSTWIKFSNCHNSLFYIIFIGNNITLKLSKKIKRRKYNVARERCSTWLSYIIDYNTISYSSFRLDSI